MNKKRPVLTVGKTYVRNDVIKRHFGELQTGISYSAYTPHYVAIFLRSRTTKSYGYIDGVHDKFLLFCGEGRSGSQRMGPGNQKLREAKAIYIFKSLGGNEVVYLGQATYVDHFLAKNKDQHKKMREVIIHQLLPRKGCDLRDIPPVDAKRLNLETVIEEIEEEHRFKEVISQAPRKAGVRLPAADTNPKVIDPREARLVENFRQFLKTKGIAKANALRISPRYCLAPIEADLSLRSVSGAKFVGEAKGESNREMIRMAIGQLADYWRGQVRRQFPYKFILLPEKPEEDLVELLLLQNMSIVYRGNNNDWIELQPKKPRGSGPRPRIWQ